jgi:hypothetical protein
MRKYSSVIPEMTINGTLSASATTITLDNNTWPAVASGDKLTLVIDPDTANEEIVYVTQHIVNTYDATILRGQEGTTAREHVAKKVRHMVTAADLQEAHQHMANSTDVHGLIGLDTTGNTTGGNVVGTRATQELYNKRIDCSNNNTILNIPAANVTGLSGTYAPLASPNFSGTPQISGAAIATQAYANGKLPEPTTNGIAVKTAEDTAVARTIVSGTPSTISITNGDGVAGNPSISFIGSAAGVSSITGTANQITASASTGNVTLSFPTTGFTIPVGSVLATGGTPTAGDNSLKVATTAFVTTAVAAGAASTVLWYRRTADSSTIGSTATNMFATSPSLDANSWYYFKIYALVTASAGSPTTHQVTLSFSSTPQSISANSSLNGYNHNFAVHINSTSATSITQTVSYSGDGLLEIEGFFQTNSSTGGTFAPKLSVASGSLVVKTGSHIQVQKLSTSSASINGTWT